MAAIRTLWGAAAALALVAPASGQGDPAPTLQSGWTDFAHAPDPGLADPALRRGQEVFQARCQACHGVPPPNAPTATSGFLSGLPPFPGTAALALKYKGAKPAPLEERTDLTPDIVETFVRNGAGIMPPIRPTEVSDEDLQALSAYLARRRP